MIKQVSVPQFQTSDDKTFTDMAAAIAHQATLDHAVSIAAFLAANDINERTGKTVSTYILQYMAYLANQKVAPAAAAPTSAPVASNVAPLNPSASAPAAAQARA